MASYKKERFHKGPDYVLKSGKYEGKTLAQVVEIDWEYILIMKSNLKIKHSVIKAAIKKKYPTKE